MKKYLKILTAMVISSSTLIGVSLLNKITKIHAVSKNLLEKDKTKEFEWRFGNIKYRKNGDTWEVEDDTELVRVFNFKIEEE